MSGLRRIPAFCDRGDRCEHFFVQHAHVSPRFLVAISDFLADRGKIAPHLIAHGRKFTTHFLAQLQNLRFHGFDVFGQSGQLAHLFLENLHPIGQRRFHDLLRERAPANPVPELPTTVASSPETVQIEPRP